MTNFFNIIFYQPILNIVIYIYNIIPGHEIGLVIIVLAVLVKLATWPLNAKILKSQKMMNDLQPKLEELKKKYVDDKEGLSKAMMELYKAEKVNPFASCLPMLIQLPIFMAVYRVFRDELSGKAITMLYPFVSHPGVINATAFGFLSFDKPNLYLAVITAVAQFFQAKLMPMKPPATQGEGSKDESMAVMMNKQMLFISPILTFMFCATVPSGLAFYWLLITVLSIVQQKMIFHSINK
ncbi:MAG: YidC/Oxa1 family membrane protein insertase [Candidatus Falkowbacteria bacterium]